VGRVHREAISWRQATSDHRQRMPAYRPITRGKRHDARARVVKTQMRDACYATVAAVAPRVVQFRHTRSHWSVGRWSWVGPSHRAPRPGPSGGPRNLAMPDDSERSEHDVLTKDDLDRTLSLRGRTGRGSRGTTAET
jgi:hypothetical protein